MAALDVKDIARHELPAALGAAEARVASVRLRIAELSNPTPQDTRLLTVVEAAAHAGVSPRWLRSKTRGLRFRKDLSAKTTRFDLAGLNAWLNNRRAR